MAQSASLAIHGKKLVFTSEERKAPADALQSARPIVVAEGYATGASLKGLYSQDILRDKRQVAFVVAFDAGSGLHAARALRDCFPDVKQTFGRTSSAPFSLIVGDEQQNRKLAYWARGGVCEPKRRQSPRPISTHKFYLSTTFLILLGGYDPPGQAHSPMFSNN
jgi:hypothetical protein